jgi:hypothetical protein
MNCHCEEPPQQAATWQFPKALQPAGFVTPGPQPGSQWQLFVFCSKQADISGICRKPCQGTAFLQSTQNLVLSY